MLKKNTLGNASAKSLGEAFKCGECLHHKHYPHGTRKETCIKEGVKAVAIAPKCFTPDITRVAGNADQFVQLVSFFQDLTHAQARTFLGLLRQKNGTRKKVPIGTKLYFKVGRDYISNYLCGYVAGFTSAGELMLIGSPEKVRGQSFISFMDKDSEDLLTGPQWKLKRDQLKAENKLFDPTNQQIKRASVTDAYEPPSIDKAPREFYEKARKGAKGKTTNKKAVRDVVDLMSFTA